MIFKSQLILKDACAWPNLFLLSGDLIGAVIFNRPSHGLEEGSLELWSCPKDAPDWQYLSTPAPGPPGQNRMHSACGVGHDGTVNILSTGFSIADGKFVRLESLWLSQSMDGGKTWQIQRDVAIEGIEDSCVPHGLVASDAKGNLFATVYRGYGKGQPSYTWLIQSGDGEHSWSVHSRIGDGDTNEAWLAFAESLKMAAVRTHIDHHTRFFTCSSEGSRWQDQGPLTLPMQHTGHLLSLGDEKLLLTYGIRNKGLMAIGCRFSENLGATWQAPFVLHQFPEEATDCGYPSTIHLEGNIMLSGYYTNCSDDHDDYQFGVLRWDLGDFLSPRQLLSISDGKKMSL
ncbi:MAG: sialidase family protein [Desulfocapsaceae bacterium]|nr:sialidase family protein [Desulfocapsaceae bacterium]